MTTAKRIDIPNWLKLAAAAVAAIVTIVSAAWSVECHYARKVDLAELGKEFQRHQVEQQIDSNQERLWKIQDRLDKKPDDESARRQQKELEFQKERLQQRLQQIDKEVR